MNEDRKRHPVPSDNPIRGPEEDRLGRMESARSFAQQVLELDASEGVAVGIFGPWGSGKTSFINLARQEFKCKQVPILDFNPWIFSGMEQLVERFFAELSAEMGETSGLEEVSQTVRKYGGAISGVTSVVSGLLGMSWIGGIVKALPKVVSDVFGQPESASQLRKKIEDALRNRGKPVVVVLDDVDRLSVSEILDVFKLVRLTASFPNLIYIVACDRLRVEQVLVEDGLPGRAYLEKIIQLPFKMPEVPGYVLRDQVVAAVEDALAGFEDHGPRSDERIWRNVYDHIILPLIWNMRDVRRYATAVKVASGSLNGEVAHVDVIALEAVRMFLPDVFNLLPSMIGDLTISSSVERNVLQKSHHGEETSRYQSIKAQIQKGCAKDDGTLADEMRKKAADAMLEYIFPEMPGCTYESLTQLAGVALKKHRVAHEHVLRFYLERVIDDDLRAFHDAERAFARMADRNELDRVIRLLDRARWQDVITHLHRSFGDEFSKEHVESGVIVLLNLLPDASRQSNVFDTTPGECIRCTQRLLSVLDDAAAVEATVRRILTQVPSLSSQLELVIAVGHREGHSGAKLVSETVAAELEWNVRDAIRSAAEKTMGGSVNAFAAEWNLYNLIQFTEWDDSPIAPIYISDKVQLTVSLLRTAKYDVISSSGSHPCLPWERLIKLYGDEATLRKRINDLRMDFDDGKQWIEHQNILFDEAKRLLALAERYLSGWRPETNL